jgi:predicted transcriptional regulator
MTPTQAAKVQRLADRRKVTMSQVVREAVEDMRG